MLSETDFEFVELLDEKALQRHPVWCGYAGVDDRDQILTWGIPEQRIDAELERYEFCGTTLHYPVLSLDPLPDLARLIVAVRFAGPSGPLAGYVIGERAFGIFATGVEYSFNRTLPSFAASQAKALAATLGVGAEALFPLRWEATEPRLRSAAGTRLGGEIDLGEVELG